MQKSRFVALWAIPAPSWKKKTNNQTQKDNTASLVGLFVCNKRIDMMFSVIIYFP